MLSRVLACSLATLALVGCATATETPAGPYSPNSAFQVTLTDRRLDVTSSASVDPRRVRVLVPTKANDRHVYFITGLAAGEALAPKLIFQPHMSDSERLAYVAAAVGAWRGQALQVGSAIPVRFDEWTGARAPISGLAADGRPLSGSMEVSEIGDRLYAIVFVAEPSAPRYARVEAEHLYSTVRMNFRRQ